MKNQNNKTVVIHMKNGATTTMKCRSWRKLRDKNGDEVLELVVGNNKEVFSGEYKESNHRFQMDNIHRFTTKGH